MRKKDADYIGVLDNRAATYTKLAQYDLALSDSRQIIRRDKHDERVIRLRIHLTWHWLRIEQGYLRCAKVLILDGNPEKALDVYAYGLRTLPDEHPQRQVSYSLYARVWYFRGPLDRLRVTMSCSV